MPKHTFPAIVRKKLFTVVDDHVVRKHEFLSNPERDFTRHRKLSLDNMIKATMLLGSGSIDKEMLEYFDYQPDTVTASAFTQQRDKLSGTIFKSIFYQFTHSFAHMMAKGWKFLIRVKDKSTRSMLGTFNTPASGEFDQIVHRELTRKQTKQVRQNPDRYKLLPTSVTFDFLDENTKFYPISLRAVRVQLEDGSYQCFITNLEDDVFPPEVIKSLYYLRWGIETSFRELKHTLELTHLHSKKKESIAQEIFAKMTMYNFCSIITSHVVIQKEDRKYDYQVNFSKAISICKHYFKENNAFLDICKLIQKYILPVRRGRTSPRKVNFRTFVSFNYRIA